MSLGAAARMTRDRLHQPTPRVPHRAACRRLDFEIERGPRHCPFGTIASSSPSACASAGRTLGIVSKRAVPVTDCRPDETAATHQIPAVWTTAPRRLLFCLQPAGNLANDGADRGPSASAALECCIAGADGQRWPRRSARLLACRSRALAIRSGRVRAFRLPAIAEPPPSRWSCAEMAKIAEGRAGRIDPLEEGPAQRIVASGRSVLHVGSRLWVGRRARHAVIRLALRVGSRRRVSRQVCGERTDHGL